MPSVFFRGNIVNIFHVQAVKDMKQHCEDKLLVLFSDYMRTAAGRQLGAPLHQAVLDFYHDKVTLQQLLLKHSNGA